MNNAQTVLEQSKTFFDEEILTKVSNSVYIAKNETMRDFLYEKIIKFANNEENITYIEGFGFLLFNFKDGSVLMLSGLNFVVIEYEKQF